VKDDVHEELHELSIVKRGLAYIDLQMPM